MPRSVDVDRFLAALAAHLYGSAAMAPGAAADVADFARQVAGLIGSAAPDSGPAGSSSLPVCRHWSPALAASIAALRQPLARLAARLHWTQTAHYRHAPPSPAFLDNYGYAVIAGPAAGAPALVSSEALALGVLLLGPHTHYPLHRHPAVELYVVLTRGGRWRRGTRPWRIEPPGTVIHHPSLMPHATRSGARPLLAVYLWRGDLATAARFVGRQRNEG